MKVVLSTWWLAISVVDNKWWLCNIKIQLKLEDQEGLSISLACNCYLWKWIYQLTTFLLKEAKAEHHVRVIFMNSTYLWLVSLYHYYYYFCIKLHLYYKWQIDKSSRGHVTLACSVWPQSMICIKWVNGALDFILSKILISFLIRKSLYINVLFYMMW